MLLFALGSSMSLACAAGTAPDDEPSSAGVTGSGGSTATATNGAAASSVADVGVGVGTSGSGGSGDCGPGKGDIFVLSKEYDLHRFDPKALTFSKVGPLACPQGGGAATPFSMAVDRSGTAWVLYNDGKLYQASTVDASCTATAFVPDQLGFKKFGMGFATDAPGSDAETLFVASETGLGSIDLGTLAVKKRGSFGFSAAVELTGNANAELFGLFFGFPPYIAKLDKDTSALDPEQDLDGVEIGSGFAFAFWGGGFWVFTAPGGSSSRVDRYDPGTKQVEAKVASVGFKIVGAGVSTCAPVENPK